MKTPLTKKKRQVIKELYPNNISIVKIKNSSPLFLEGKKIIKDNLFMSSERKKLFLDSYNNMWETKSNNTTIYLFLDNVNINKWKDLLKLLYWRVNFMREIAKNKKPLVIWIYPSDYKKQLPKNKVITPDDINSGSTTTYIGKNENGIIYIWRKEEILKVLIHELIHSFNIDKNDPNPKEAYVELRALEANIILELLERQLPLTNVNTLYNYEKLFSVEQSKKINNYTDKNTNIKAYINEKGRLLHNINKKEWDEYLINTEIKNPLVNKKSLRFTISDVILNTATKIDLNGNTLNIP
jgi:hypothetical protein